MSQPPQSVLTPVHEAWLPREHSLHRPRHSGRQLTALVCALVFFTTPVLAFAFGARPGEIENRPLTEFPSPTGWSFFTGLSPWGTDHLALRGEAIVAADAISRGVFGEPPPLGPRNQPSGPLPADPGSEEPRQPAIPVSKVVEGKDGWLYLGDEVSSRCNVKVDLAKTFARLRLLRDGVESTGRQFVLVVAPDKVTMEPEHLPDRFAERDCLTKLTADFWRHAEAARFIVDLRPGLRTWSGQLGRPIYPRLDAHWTDEGGLLMARALAETVQPGVTDPWRIDPGEQRRVPADLPPLLGRDGDITVTQYAVRPDGQRDQTRRTNDLFRTPLRLTSEPMTGKVTRKVALMADSFTIRALPYLAASFSDLTVLHYGSVRPDNGAKAGAMLADHEVVAFEVVERILMPEYNELITQEVVGTIIRKLAERPLG